MKSLSLIVLFFSADGCAFTPTPAVLPRTATHLYATEEKMVKLVSGEELEIMLQDLEQPLVVDAYATWW